MIKIIYGSKGSGKTKMIIESANNALDVCKGNIVFITDTLGYSKDVKTAIRFFNVKDYAPSYNEDMFKGFIRGIAASNTDIKRIYIDGICRIIGLKADELEEYFLDLESIAHASGIDIILTVSCDTLPVFLKKYTSRTKPAK